MANSRAFALCLLALAGSITLNIDMAQAADAAPPASQPATTLPANAAEEKAVTDAGLAVYQQATKDLIDGQFTALIPHLADNGRPVLPAPRTEEKIKKLAEEFARNAEGIAKTKEIVQAVLDKNPELGQATFESVVIKKIPSLIVRIPCKGTEEIAQKYGLRGSPSGAINDKGELVILLIRQGEDWYWNPFGW